MGKLAILGVTQRGRNALGSMYDLRRMFLKNRGIELSVPRQVSDFRDKRRAGRLFNEHLLTLKSGEARPGNRRALNRQLDAIDSCSGGDSWPSIFARAITPAAPARWRVKPRYVALWSRSASSPRK